MKKNGKNKKTVAVATLGCKVNQFESASIENSFTDRDIELTPFSGRADIYVINTCAVTAKAAAQSRRMIRRAMRKNPKARIMVTGCYAQVEPDTIIKITGDPLSVVGNNRKDILAQAAVGESDQKRTQINDISNEKNICHLPVTDFANRTRPFLKIQDGCNNFCTYCIVPFARGRSRSLEPEAVLAQAARFAGAGYLETVVTGIHVGHYGHDLRPKTELTDITKKLLNHTPGMRYRISSLEPSEITPALLGLLAEDNNLAPHLHIPLQSGDDHILKKMHRRYRASDFAGIINQALARVPGLSIGVDVLVGFPGEDDIAFDNTFGLLDRLPIAYLHVFPYSRREGTVAAGMSGQIPTRVKEERVARLRALDREKRLAFYEKNLGTVRRVLAENGSSRGGRLHGFSENYIPVRFKAPAGETDRIHAVRLDEIIDERTVRGTRVLD